MITNIWKSLLILSLILVVFSSCSDKNEVKNQKEEIKIGAILPLTGNLSILGESMKNGIELARKDIGNSKYKYTIFYQDNIGSVKNSINAFRYLVDTEKVDKVITTLSPVCLAIKPIAEKRGILFFANASHPDITKNAKYTFRLSNTINQESNLITERIKAFPAEKINKILIIYPENDFGLGFKKVLEKMLSDYNIKTIGYDFSKGIVKSQSALIQNFDPDAIVAVGGGNSFLSIFKTLSDINYRKLVFTNIGFIFISKKIKYIDFKVYYTDYNFPDSFKEKISKKYKSIFGKNLNDFVILGYLNLKVLHKVISDSGINPKDNFNLGEYMKNKILIINGVKITINKNGDILPPMTIREFVK